MPYTDPDEKRAYQREWIAARREAWLVENGPCIRCGSDEALEVDHIDPAQKVTHRIWSWSAARRAEELAKCQVLCGDCHLQKTHGEGLSGEGHGSRRCYDAGCRCDPCKLGARTADQERRARARSDRGLEVPPRETSALWITCG